VEQKEEDERRHAPGHLVAFAHLGEAGNTQANGQAGEDAEEEAADRQRARLRQGHKEQQPERNTLEDILRKQPTHGEAVCWWWWGIALLKLASLLGVGKAQHAAGFHCSLFVPVMNNEERTTNQ